MHFGIVSTSYPRFAGDPAGGFVHGLNRHLHRLGHRVSVVCAGDSDAAVFERLDGIAVHRLPSSLFFRGGAPDALVQGLRRKPIGTLGLAMQFSVDLVRAVAQFLSVCDALISHWLVPCGLVAGLVSRGRPHVAIAHSSDVHLLRRLGLANMGRWFAARADLVYTAEHLVIDGAPGRVVPMGIDVAEFALRDGERQAIRHKLGLYRPTLLCLGRLVPVKGVSVLLSALRRLRHLDIELIVAGDGPLRSPLEAEAHAQGLPVRFVGEVLGRDKRQWLAAADLLVLPSLQLPDGRTEGAPVVIWEALASGLPVVASAVGGTTAQLGGCGLAVPPGDAQALAQAIETLLGDPMLAARLRPHGPKQAAQPDWAQVAKRLLPRWLDVPAAAEVDSGPAVVLTNQHPNCYRERYK